MKNHSSGKRGIESISRKHGLKITRFYQNVFAEAVPVDFFLTL
jgi:hypothetical protein